MTTVMTQIRRLARPWGLAVAVFVVSVGSATADPPQQVRTDGQEKAWAGVAVSVVNDEGSKRIVVAQDGYAAVVSVELGVRVAGRISVGIEGWRLPTVTEACAGTLWTGSCWQRETSAALVGAVDVVQSKPLRLRVLAGVAWSWREKGGDFSGVYPDTRLPYATSYVSHDSRAGVLLGADFPVTVAKRLAVVPKLRVHAAYRRAFLAVLEKEQVAAQVFVGVGLRLLF
jgi:hypothetical protein